MELIQPLCDIMKAIWTPISRRVDYAINLSKNFIELSRRVKELCHKRDDIKDQIDLVKQQKAPTRECNDWFANVDEIEKHVKMIEEEHLVDKRWFSHVIARVKFGKHVVEMMEQVKELHQNSKFESGFVIDLPPGIVEKRPVIDNLFMGNSTNLTLQKILDSIRDEGVQKIGIWGMGGVGKTTLMNLLNNMPKIQTMFQIVIWVTVSKSRSIRNIQNEVANRLSLPNVSDKSNDRVSTMLCRKLEGMKYLLLLDDVWEWVDLSKVGIPSQEKGCKIVLTTRDHKVCRMMETNVDIKVKVLDKKEAWEMFNSKAGQVVSLLPTIKSIAEKIVEKCGGLPLAVRVVSGALRMVEDVSIWRNFLNKLNSPASSYIEAMNEDVFKPLKVSYDELKDANTKKCFLYCGLYAEDKEIKISKLIRYWRAEGFLPSKASLEDAYDDGRAKLHDLIGASLLDKCKDENHVKMHDVVRDLVLKMTSSAATAGEERSRCMVRAGLQIANDDDDKAEWEEASRISFMDAKGYKLPEMPKCAKLSTLLLQSRHFSQSVQKIPECFFNHMPNLRVLDLSRSGISTLPSSISNLVNLRALLLKKCWNFEAFPQEVSALQRLEVLHVSGTYSMVYQPFQIWKLTSLKSLRFSPFALNVRQEEMKMEMEMVPTTPSVTISRLSLLEDLSIKSIRGDEESWESLTKEVGSLTRLSSLKLQFRTKNGLKHFLHDSQAWRDCTIKKFYFRVGHYDQVWDLSKGYERCLLINAGFEGGVLPCEINEVLIRSEFFYLACCRTVSDLGIAWEKVNGLKSFVLFDCELEYMGDGDGLRGNAFSKIEFLYLISISGLRGICYDRLPMQQQLSSSSSSSNSFTKLQHLKISNCNQMKKVFPWGLIPQLLNLEFLDIDNCRELEEIISVDFDEDNRLEHMNLLKLKFLSLWSLPKFIGFSKRKRNHLYLHCPSLEEVTFYCPKLEVFPFGIDSAPNLRKISGNLKWWEALKWEDDATKARFSPLFFELKRNYY